MWKLKKQLWPKKPSTLPIGKHNHRGRLISSPKELMQTLKKEYKDRLRPRLCKENVKEHMSAMHNITREKLAESWKNKSPCFSIQELETCLNNLNKGKARDPSGLCSELFQINVMGSELKISLL